MAVNGKQPAIPENMPLVPPSHRDKRQRTEATRKALPALTVPAEVAATATAGGEADTAAAGTSAAAANGAFEEGALVRAPLKHVVSKELHLYYNKVVSALETALPPPAPASKELLAALASLRTDAGLQPLAPYLAHFLTKKVGVYLASAPRLSILLRAAVSLGSNPSLDLGPYLHEIMPAVLTCLLAHSVGENHETEDGTGGNGDNAGDGSKSKKSKNNKNDQSLDPDALHWTIREEAARAAAALCATYPDAAPRVQRQLLSILASPTSSLPSRYGAVVGLEAQGPRVVRSLLLPNLIPAVVALKDDLVGKNGAQKANCALKVRGALLAACGYCVYLSGVCAPWNITTGGGNVGGSRKEGEKEEEEEAMAAAAGAKKKKTAAAATKKKDRKAQPKIAKMSREDAEAMISQTGSIAAPGGAAAGKRKGGKKTAAAPTTTTTSAPVALSEVFGEEEDHDGKTTATLATAGQNSLKKVLTIAGNMRPTNKDNEDLTISSNGTTTVPAPGLILENLPTENYLADAWQENFPVDCLHRAMEELFGDDIAPYER
jgi:hypothetical protein